MSEETAAVPPEAAPAGAPQMKTEPSAGMSHTRDVPLVPETQHVFILQQLSVFLENQPGRLREAVAQLAAAGVNLRALSIAETERYGIMRLLADDTHKAAAALHEAGVTSVVSDVIGVEVPDRPGGLGELLSVLGTEVSVDYMYAELQGRGDRALLIMKLDPADRALDLLHDSGLY